MFKYSLSWYIFTFTLLETIVKTHLTAHDSSHGFISNNQRYFDDDLATIHEEISSGLRSARINDGSLKLQLKFEPAVLDFKHRPLGVPHLEKVTLFNIDANKSIDMTSISGSTVHFHSSFFEDKKIPPLGNTSFNVVFLGREEGFVESSLFIHTTEGHFKYNVKGASIFSPYRLRPIVGIKLPLNATFAPLIYLYNPHSEPIQITEIYSSGGDFHLELPTGELEGPKNLWEIPPLHTRPIIRVRFVAKTEQNHTAYVRIKVNSSDEILVVPLEVEVTGNGGGIFAPQGSLDFGIGGNLDPPKQVPICLYNSLKKPVRIHSITTDSDAIKIDYENIKLLPSAKERENCVKIGTVHLNWDVAFKSKDYAGKIMVKYKNGKCKTEIPYYLTVLEGGLSYDPLVTRYFINDKMEDLVLKTVKMKNNFLDSIRIINVTLMEEADNFFTVVNFQSSVIKPQQELNVFTLKLKTGNLSELKINSNILVKTNISDLIIPLLSYNGKLFVQIPYEGKDNSLDLGLISTSSEKEVYVLVANTNPVQINLKNIQTSISMSCIEKIGCGTTTNYKLTLLSLSFKNLTKCSILKTNSFAILKLTVKTPDSQTQQWGTIQIETQYENLSIPVHFKVSPGKLEIGPDRLVFDQCFPGKICSHPLRVYSTFYEPMIIENILTLPPDKRVFSKHSGHVSARATKVVGHLFLDPTVDCGSECYAGMQHDTTAQWLSMLSLPSSVSDLDLNLVNTFYNRYLNATGNGLKNWQNLTLRLDTDQVKGHLFKSRVKMSWPSLVLLDDHPENKSVAYVTFPLTQIGNVTYKNITIRNPSSYNLIIQLVFDRTYPDVHLLYEGLPTNFLPQNIQESSKIKHGFFFDSNYKSDVEKFTNLLNYNVNEDTLPLVLPPNENFTFTIGFRGEDTILNSALIFIRNNLTILEIIRLKGQAAWPSFKFGNRKPGSSQPLQFELTEKHLKECKNQMPNLTVKRSFTARNLGDVTIYINQFRINDLQCEGYGFRIVNCGPLVLPPNSTKKIDIAFTPDLTLTKITRTLILETSLNMPVNYTLHTTIPSFYLNLCANFIMRPNWEYYLSLLSISLMFTLLIVIVLLAIVDSDKIKKQTLACLLHTSNVQTQPVLDLRLVGQQTRDEIHTNKINEQKTERKLLDEKVKEPEKYTVLIPTIGKSKKKLAKRNSNESTNDCATETKKVELKTTCKNTMKIKEDDKKLQKEAKKLIQNKAKAKNVPVLVYEEETQTTESSSSSNNDESEDQRKNCVKKTQVTNKIMETNNEEMNERNHSKMERKKSGQKPAIIQKAAVNEKSMEKSETKKCFRNNNIKKDKQIGKKVLEKSVNNPRNGDFSRNSPNANRVSPPISQQTVWGENRATFSDIVARTEQPPIRPLKQLENYNRQTTELGPIGSGRSEFWQESQDFDQSNSFFSNAQDLQVLDANGGFLDDFGDSNWQNGLIDLPNENCTDLWNQTNLIDTNSYWSSMDYTLPAMQQQTQQQVQQVNSQTGFLWGSSSVWEPWAPPRTPTRTPPGFDVAHQRRNEEQTQQREVYNPFGTNCLWTQQQQQQNPWNFQ